MNTSSLRLNSSTSGSFDGVADQSEDAIRIRPAKKTDLCYLPDIESAADQIFRKLDMMEIADSEPSPSEARMQYYHQGHVWVAVSQRAAAGGHGNSKLQSTEEELLVAFIQVADHDNAPTFHATYIHQIAVSPSYARQGIGKRLIEVVQEWAAKRGSQALDLTTFDDVPWNKAYYERLGFQLLEGRELQTNEARGVREVREMEEKDELLRRWKRVAMRKLIRTRGEQVVKRA